MYKVEPENQLISRLTVLWALSESGLGGIMHALKIPLTGIFVGGVAVIIIALMAHYSQRNFRIILQSTLLVILVKAAVSPQSPFPAYIAVCFQGLCGSAIYYFIDGFRLASMLFGFIALVESALQKFLLTTILFGKTIWDALDSLTQSILRDFHLPADFSISFWLVTCYALIHAFWGILLGNWASGVPKKISLRTPEILKEYARAEKFKTVTADSRTKKNNKWLSLLFILTFIIAVLYLEGRMNKVLYIILRTIAILIFTYGFIVPFTKWALTKLQSKNKEKVTFIINQLPEMKNLVRPAYFMASVSYSGITRYKEFVFILIVLSLFNQTPKSNP